MASTVIFPTSPPLFSTSSSLFYSTRPFVKLRSRQCAAVPIHCSISGPELPVNYVSLTGAAYDFSKATTSLTNELLPTSKKVTLVRHGLSSWNDENRIQGSSDLSVLTETGVKQAERCKAALMNKNFDRCFSSPISRAKSTAEIIWQNGEKPIIFLDSLKELPLGFLEGLKVEYARKAYPMEYKTWREDPANLFINGIYPFRNLLGSARRAWREILMTPGENHIVVTHKSILRALICSALGLGPERLRAIDINNGGITEFKFNTRGEPMLESLNMTTHLYVDHVYPN